MSQSSEPHVTVNGRPRPLAGVAPHTNLLDFLRGVGLTGAKEGCAEGECGACAVMVARPDGDGTRWTAINSCLAPAAALDGQEVITSEGLGSPGALHPVQAELAHRGGSQCGYCTPGFVCSMAAEFYRPEPTRFWGERLRHPRDRRQPVSLHRLSTDPRRGRGARGAGRRRPPVRTTHTGGTCPRADSPG